MLEPPAIDDRTASRPRCSTATSTTTTTAVFHYHHRKQDVFIFPQESGSPKTLHTTIFSGSHGTLAQKHEGRFSSSIRSGAGKDELELPIAMVCIVATTNHASLDDWSLGYKRNKSDFRADTYEYIYRGHELFLNTLHEIEPAFYHTLMSDLYKAVAVKGTRSATHIANNAIARLNLPARET